MKFIKQGNKMKYKVKMASKIFNRILKKTLSVYLNKRYRVEFDDKEIQGIEPPFVIVGNHTNNWDAFIVAYKIKDPVHFVASIEQFRGPFMKFVMGLVGSIPKTKSMSDAAAVKGMFKVRNNGGIVGIYPEGKRSWDGKTEDILYPTAKMLKSMNVPVISVLTHGAYLTHPRWAHKARRGKILLKYDVLFTAEDIKNLSVDEIYGRMCRAIQTNEYEWQEKEMIPFVGPRPAEDMELSLFICPRCNQIGKLYSKGDTLTCKACGEAVRYNIYGYFEKDSGEKPIFKSFLDWNQWQMGRLEEMIRIRMTRPELPIFEDTDVTLYTGDPYVSLKKDRKGAICLYINRIEFKDKDGNTECYDISRMNGVSTHLKDRFDFYHEGKFHRVAFKDHHTSANKWTEAYDRIKKIAGV